MPQLDDQAAGLRRIAGGSAVKVIAVTSGKGGVGKTAVSVNLAIALAQRGRSTLLLDADLSLANVDVLLGLKPSANLEQVVAGEVALEDVIVRGPAGIRVMPAASGVTRLAALGSEEVHGLIGAFSTLPTDVDVMVVDTASGIGCDVLGFASAAHEVVVVVCDEPASITDAYATIKVLSRERGVRRFQVLCNKVKDATHGTALYTKLLAVCDRFLDVELAHFGTLPECDTLPRAARLQKAVVEGFPTSVGGRAFKELARRADTWNGSASNEGRPLFFYERLLAARAPAMTAAG